MKTDISSLKKQMRLFYRDARKKIDNNYSVFASQIIKKHCIKQLKKYKVIAAYSPIDGEINVLSLVEELQKLNHIILQPAFYPGMDSYEFENWNILDNPRNKHYPEAIIIPLIAFDLKMNRLGFGKGWYDQAIAKLKSNVFKLGVAYEVQFTDIYIPCEKHDIPMDAVITEKAYRDSKSTKLHSV